MTLSILLDVLEHAIKIKALAPYTARVFVDGIDRKKAAELTNALRLRGVSLEIRHPQEFGT